MIGVGPHDWHNYSSKDILKENGLPQNQKSKVKKVYFQIMF
jgi:hypothetical protein